MAPTGTAGTELTRKERIYSFALVTSLFFTWGFSYGLLDVLNAHFQTVFHITKLQSTLLQFAYFGAYFVWAPFAGEFMSRIGYKKGIHIGLGLYSLGAIFFWPSAKFEKYGGFVGSTFVIGCGLATLEVAANSYISVLGSPEYAAVRLNFSQGFQGIASFSGPLIASRWFFTGANATSLGTVQWVYLAVAVLGVVLNILFFFSELPEISSAAPTEEFHDGEPEPFRKQYRCIFGWVAQTAYVGAQVGVASFTVNYLVDQDVGISQATASDLFSFCQITFTVARFVGALLLNYVDPALVLAFFGCCCSIFSILVSQLPKYGGINLGVHTKRGSGLIVMGVGGGAWYPPAQGALADKANTRRSYLVPMSGFIAMTIYAIGLVIHQATQKGFTVFNRPIDAPDNSDLSTRQRNSTEKKATNVELFENNSA